MWNCIITDRVSTGGNAIASVRLSVHPSIRLSVRLFPLYLSNRLTFGLDLLRMCVGHYHGSQGIETEGHRSRSRRSRFDSILNPAQARMLNTGMPNVRLKC